MIKFDVSDLGATANDTEDGSVIVDSTIYALTMVVNTHS